VSRIVAGQLTESLELPGDFGGDGQRVIKGNDMIDLLPLAVAVRPLAQVQMKT
jgi:hypothetical protein